MKKSMYGATLTCTLGCNTMELIFQFLKYRMGLNEKSVNRATLTCTLNKCS